MLHKSGPHHSYFLKQLSTRLRICREDLASTKGQKQRCKEVQTVSHRYLSMPARWGAPCFAASIPMAKHPLVNPREWLRWHAEEAGHTGAQRKLDMLEHEAERSWNDFDLLHRAATSMSKVKPPSGYFARGRLKWKGKLLWNKKHGTQSKPFLLHRQKQLFSAI